MAELALEGVSRQFPDGTFAVKDVSLEVADKEFLVLVGPSGCGKSTTLRMVAGLDRPTVGKIKISGAVVDDRPPKDRNIAMVFQNYALYPHMSVYRNLSFGLLLRYGGGVLNRGLIRIFQPRKSAQYKRLRLGIDHKVRQTAERLGISHLLSRKPYQLSGGERQRVALGRAIVREPAVFLFDEPLSNLDAKLRQEMREELKRLHRELGATVVYVTHDQVEAMTMGDRIAVMKDGEILQTGTPDELYRRPTNTYVARFIGSVPTNLIRQNVIENTLTGSNGDATETLKDNQQGLLIGFRAEHACLTNRKQASPENQINSGIAPSIQFHATVRTIDRLGDSNLVTLVTATVKHTAETKVQTNPRTATTATLTNKNKPQPELANGSLAEVIVRTPGDSHWQPGQHVTVSVDRNRLMWFDLSTGNNLDRENP